MPVELGLDISPSKGSSGHLLTSGSSSDFSFPKGRGEGDEGRRGQKEEGAQPGLPALSAPTQAAGTPGFGRRFLLRLHWDGQKAGSHLEGSESAPRSEPQQPYPFMFLLLKT